MTTTRQCESCNVDKTLDEFRVIRNHRLRKCRECVSEANRKYMRGYRQQRAAEKRAQHLATTPAQPIGRPTYQQRLDTLEAQVQSLLAFASLRGYNTTET